MRVKVTLPYPLPLVEGNGKKLVAFLEKPPVTVITEEPWKYLDWRGFAVLEGERVIKQLVMRSEVTVILRAFEPRGLRGDPLKAFEALLRREAPCPVFKGFWACGDSLLKLSKEKVEPLGFGIIKTRISFNGAKMELDVA